jgi:hypothetical protein
MTTLFKITNVRRKKTKKVEGNENTNIATIPAKEIKKEDKKK